MGVPGHTTEREIGPTMEGDRGASRHGHADSRHTLARDTVLAGFAFIWAAVRHAVHRCGLRHFQMWTGRPRLGGNRDGKASGQPEHQDNKEK